ncbi:cytochrome c3 family protein [Chloroflexota bacterium]
MNKFISPGLLLTSIIISIAVGFIFFLCFNGIETAQANPDEFLHEAHFRIGDDTPLDDMEWHNITDNKTAGITRSDNFRVRFQIYNDGDGQKSWIPRLEYLEAGGSWTTVPSTSGSIPFYIAATSQFSNGDTIDTGDFALGAGTGTEQAGYAYSTTPVSPISLDAFSYTEIEFNIQANSNADYYTAYCLRLSDNGFAFDSYSNNAIVSIWENDNPDSLHYNYISTTDKCASCHRLHTGTGITLRTAWPEEDLCTTCHSGTGARTDIDAQFDKSSIHPISDTQGEHSTGEGSYNWLPTGDRHVECEDCHNPHGSQTGSSTPGFDYLSRNIEKVWGVAVSNLIAEWAAFTSDDYTRVSPITAEYQLCLKCHSSYAYDIDPPPSYSGGIDETDQAIEFNVNNDSYHWVETDLTASSGDTPRTNSASRDMSFTPGSGMAKDSPLGCSSCHASETATEARGTHGSDEAYLLRGTWSDTATGTSYSLCLQCHDANFYGPGGNLTTPDMTNFAGKKGAGGTLRPNLHTYHWTQSGLYGCQNCHSAVPHGGWNRALLVEEDDPAPYSNGSSLIIDSWGTSGDWRWTDCRSSPGCH